MSDENQKEEHHAPVRHVFDGIEEEDNDLPQWWLYLFYVTIIFSVYYLVWYHTPLGRGKTPEREFAVASALLQEKAATAKAAGYDYAAALSDAKVLSEGRETYMQMCVPCHGERGGGSVGPNLADEFWIIEPTLAAVEEVIAAGNLEKGMPAWEPVVGVEKVRQLVVFVRSLQGTNPDKPKEPQGNPGKLP